MPPEKNPEGEKKEERAPQPSIIQTYASDMAKAVKENQGSVVKIAMAEAEKREHEYVDFSPKSKKNLIFIFSAIAFILIGSGIALYTIVLKSPNKTALPVEEKNSQYLFAETNKEVPIDGLSIDQILGSVRNEIINSPLKLGTIENIYFTKTSPEKTKIPISTSDFFSLLNIQIPGALSRAISSDFMIGIYSWNGTTPFMLFKVPNFQTGFSGMLAWESKLLDSFYKLFNISTEGPNANIFNTKFSDAIIKNKDARVIYNTDGKIVFLYLFLNENTIFISTNSSALDEVTNRFLLQQK